MLCSTVGIYLLEHCVFEMYCPPKVLSRDRLREVCKYNNKASVQTLLNWHIYIYINCL